MNLHFLYRLATIVSVLLSEVRCDKQSSTVLTLYSPHFPGEFIGHFQLKERLDILGVEKTYRRDDYDDAFEVFGSISYDPSEKYLPGGGSGDTDRIKVTNHHHDLSTVDEIHVNSSDESVKNGQYYLNRKIFFGGHGEIWLGRRILENGNVDLENSYVLKRMHIKDRPGILRCALREIYYGDLLRDNPRMAQFLTHFQIDDDYWLVFRDEGVSLQSLLYALSINKGNVLLEPSAIWRNMRTTKRGQDSMRSILYEAITGELLMLCA